MNAPAMKPRQRLLLRLLLLALRLRLLLAHRNGCGSTLRHATRRLLRKSGTGAAGQHQHRHRLQATAVEKTCMLQ